MHLGFLHGAPATGKYIVGCELAALMGFELYHNPRTDLRLDAARLAPLAAAHAIARHFQLA
jgi:hypothetical protein